MTPVFVSHPRAMHDHSTKPTPSLPPSSYPPQSTVIRRRRRRQTYRAAEEENITISIWRAEDAEDGLLIRPRKHPYRSTLHPSCCLYIPHRCPFLSFAQEGNGCSRHFLKRAAGYRLDTLEWSPLFLGCVRNQQGGPKQKAQP